MNTVTDPMLDLSQALASREAFVLAGIADALESTRVFVESVMPPPPTPVVWNAGSESSRVSAGGGNDSIIRSGGQITQEQFAALNQCEASGENGWRTGRYGEEAGYPIGQLSEAEQQARAQAIFDAHGASAWGVSCRGILGG